MDEIGENIRKMATRDKVLSDQMKSWSHHRKMSSYMACTTVTLRKWLISDNPTSGCKG